METSYKKYFDVIVVGSSPAALLSAMYFGKNARRVMLLGEKKRSASYTFEEIRLWRRASSIDWAHTGSFRTLLRGVGEGPSFFRRLERPDPSFQILAGRERYSFFSDAERTLESVEREGAGDGSYAREFLSGYATARARLDESIDKASRGSLPRWLAAESDETRDGGVLRALDWPLLHRLEPFVAGMDHGDAPSHARAIALGNTLQGTSRFGVDEDAFVGHCAGELRNLGVEVVIDESIERVLGGPKRTEGVILARGGEAIGSDHFVADWCHEDFVKQTGALKTESNVVATVTSSRVSVSVVVRRDLVPSALGGMALLVSLKTEVPDFVLERKAISDNAETWILDTIIEFDRQLGRVRENAILALEAYFPFVRRHLLLVDCVYDGLPLWDFRSGPKRDIDRLELRSDRGGVGGVENPRRRWSFQDDRKNGLYGATEPMETSFRNAFLVGPTIFPALGGEGGILATLANAERLSSEPTGRVQLGRKNRLR